MSKYVKDLITNHLREQLDGVDYALLVDVIGLDANANNRLRGELNEKDMNLLVVKNSLAARATAGTPLAPLFDGVKGSVAVCWGGEDIVALAKEVTRLAKDDKYASLENRGGVLDGEKRTPEKVDEVSKWPTREEQLSRLIGQSLGPGATLAAQLTGPGSALGSQIAQRGEGEEE